MPENTYLIWNGSYVGNSMLFWRKGKAGYTADIEEAHHFTLEEAQSICRPENPHQFIDSNHCREMATLQLNANHVHIDLFGLEVSHG